MVLIVLPSNWLTLGGSTVIKSDLYFHHFLPTLLDTDHAEAFWNQAVTHLESIGNGSSISVSILHYYSVKSNCCSKDLDGKNLDRKYEDGCCI